MMACLFADGCTPEQVAALGCGMWVTLVPKDGAACSHRTQLESLTKVGTFSNLQCAKLLPSALHCTALCCKCDTTAGNSKRQRVGTDGEMKPSQVTAMTAVMGCEAVWSGTAPLATSS